MTNRLAQVWDDPKRQWPSIVYVETTNLCNYRCPCCHNWEMRRPKAVMNMDTFVVVANKIHERGAKIGAMYCNGEPLTDPTIFEKYAYANALGVFAADGNVGLNTNASLLTPDKYAALVENCPRVVLSVFAIGDRYAEATGGFSWEKAKANILGLIAYRDQHKPEFVIWIGCNGIPESDYEAVRRELSVYNVQFETSPYVNWNSRERLTGPLATRQMHPHWRCDGHKGALQIRPNCECGFCAFDFHGDDQGILETHIGNFITDSWETLEANFRQKWKATPALCARCDYWEGAAP